LIHYIINVYNREKSYGTNKKDVYTK